MQRRKQFTLGIITLLLLCILAGCQFGNQKKKTEKKVDYYIGVVDNLSLIHISEPTRRS